MSESVYIKMIVCSIPFSVGIISLAIIAKTWVSNVFRNPDAANSGFTAATLSIAAVEIMCFACIALLFYI